ncbi:MAG: 2,3-dihydroxy-p-cumate-3,4-dioxygenase (CmtC) [Pseudolabrys sp.]|jgi:2,3-dihydroxy-p-cumate/2,3-dihydroxybenzoate 3,4-dioxygenase|nr:2,3-dihydroxy-p-cumate-3,4-dioxygenase (CmtC) [Pseudolabrys sp.]
MIELKDICYVRLGTADIGLCEKFSTEVLGLDVAERSRKATYFRSNQREHTLCYFEGDPADQAVGFEVEGHDELRAAAATLEKLGHPVHEGTASECEARKVRAFIRFQDPTGNSIELAVRPAMGGVRYFGTRDAGITGFSHVGLCSKDPARDEKFWTQVCNARVSDRIGDVPLMRIHEVHHTIALFPAKRSGIQHVNHQVESSDDIMRSYCLLKEKNVPIVFGPGRHPTSSARFVYFEGPQGMVYEYSVGVREITDEDGYRERQFNFEPPSLCMWGSKPDIKEFKN